MARATGLKVSCFLRYTSFWPFAFITIQMQQQQNLDLNSILHLDLYIHNPFLYLLQNHIKQFTLCHTHNVGVHCLFQMCHVGCLFILQLDLVACESVAVHVTHNVKAVYSVRHTSPLVNHGIESSVSLYLGLPCQPGDNRYRIETC